MLAIKQLGPTNELYKARFIVQGRKDREKEMIKHISRTVGYKNIRILWTIATIFNLEVRPQDVTKAFIQGHQMQRDVYVKNTAQFKLERGMLLKILKPLYGLSKSGDHWFHKYRTFLLTKLGL